jgi:hypothetical protein
MHWLVLTLSAFANHAMPEAMLLTSPHCQVRAVDSRASAALADGLRRSPTFARLIAAINRSDVIVYVESVHTLPATISGRMMLSTKGTSFRYVRIEVSTRLVPEELIAVIGHELQHAVEVAEHPHVRSEATFIDLYRRIGAGSSTGFRYDTEAAVRTGAQVRRELTEQMALAAGASARQLATNPLRARTW